MCFPATAALEKLIRTVPEDREYKRVRRLEEPSSSLLGLDSFEMTCLDQLTNTAENDGQSSPMSPLGFPLIEWSSVAIYAEKDINYRSASAIDTPQTPIHCKEDTHSLLDRCFASETSNPVKGKPSNPGKSTTPLSSPEQQTVSALYSHNDNINNSSSKHGRLVRSIALGSRLALLEHPVDNVIDQSFCHSMNSARHRPTTCSFGWTKNNNMKETFFLPQATTVISIECCCEFSSDAEQSMLYVFFRIQVTIIS
jgi:hypothetical protein